MTIVALLAAGAIGAWLRYEIAGWLQSRTGSALPIGTGVVNILGTILFAALVALHQKDALSSEILFVLGVGFAGAFTTFSTWMVETGKILAEGGRMRFGLASVNVIGQFAVALLAGLLVFTLV